MSVILIETKWSEESLTIKLRFFLRQNDRHSILDSTKISSLKISIFISFSSLKFGNLPL